MDTLFFHPKVVHIPIALGLLMPLLAGGIVLAWWRQWLPVRSWVLVVALQATLLGSGIVALQTGESEEERVERVVSERAIEEHEEAAEAFVWASGGVLGLMLLALAIGRSKAGLPTAVLATLGTLAVLGLGYRSGTAVKTAKMTTTESPCVRHATRGRFRPRAAVHPGPCESPGQVRQQALCPRSA